MNPTLNIFHEKKETMLILNATVKHITGSLANGIREAKENRYKYLKGKVKTGTFCIMCFVEHIIYLEK